MQARQLEKADSNYSTDSDEERIDAALAPLLPHASAEAAAEGSGLVDTGFWFHPSTAEADNYRDVFAQGNCDDTVRAFVELLGWTAEFEALIRAGSVKTKRGGSMASEGASPGADGLAPAEGAAAPADASGTNNINAVGGVDVALAASLAGMRIGHDMV